MNSIWILAGAEPAQNSSDVITMEPADQQQQQSTTAQDGANGTAEPTETPEKTPVNPLMQLLPFILIFIVMYLLLFRGPRKKQQEHQKMVSSLKKNDRVRTIGGIFGTVVDVRQDDIVLKIDESNNTKIHIIPSAIGTVLTDEKN